MKFLLLFCLVKYIFGNFYNETEYPTLYQSILLKRNYDRLISPNELFRKTTHVNISVPFTILFSVEENKQIVSYIAAVNMRWFDQRLKFDPEEMGYESVIVPSILVWIPNVETFNCVELKFADGEAPSNVVRVHHTGLVSLMLKGKFETVCRCDVEGFPFDAQLCNINFATGLITVDEMELHVRDESPFLIGLPEWNVLPPVLRSETFETEMGNHSIVIASFQLTRNPQFYIWFLIMPTLVITMVCVVAILLPLNIKQGEKLSLAITGMLGFTFMLSVIVGEVPRSPNLPLMGKWLILQMFFCIAAIIWELSFHSLIKKLQKRFTKSTRSRKIVISTVCVFSCVIFVCSDLFITFVIMWNWKSEPIDAFEKVV